MKDYVLGDCLGRGAFGSVYRALNLSTGETVAIKRISLSKIPRSKLGDIMSEIEVLKRLRHPNIVKYKGFERTKEHLFIILEHCENGSLQNIGKRFGRFPEGLVSVYINQVLQGLAYLHDQGVVHRDIKGANILTTKDGSVKLADFGIAIKAGALSNDVVGSPYWMAPEVIDQTGCTEASDIWSVGCVVVELLTGQPPYAHLDPMPALFRIVQDECPPLPDDCSPMVLDFLQHCFQKDAELRVSARTLLAHPWMISARRRTKTVHTSSSTSSRVYEDVVLPSQEEPLPRRSGSRSSRKTPASQPSSPTQRRAALDVGRRSNNDKFTLLASPERLPLRAVKSHNGTEPLALGLGIKGPSRSSTSRRTASRTRESERDI